MNITLLGQGFEPISEFSVGNQIIKFLADTSFHTFTGISAFASQAGVNGLSAHISGAKKHLKIITVVTGIDQKGTSKEALEALMNLEIDAFIFYQPSFPIFHPKIYLFEGEHNSELIIGSSNLTAQGLFTNVEASILVSIDNSSSKDRKIIEQLKEYFKGIFDHSDPNLKRISPEIISNLVEAKVVPTEAERKAAQDKPENFEKLETENIISRIFPKREIAKIPSEFRGIKNSKSKPTLPEPIYDNNVIAKGEPVWESGPLTERDLNIPKGSNTNPTGSMLFKKGLTEGIDQRHYFREIVFSALKWKRDSKAETSHLERADAKFHILIDGQTSGSFKLSITHNTRTDTRSYIQKNGMTSISWGEAKKVIANENLIGKSAYLYKTKIMDEFILEIN